MPRSLTPTNPPAGLTSGKEPWLYTISSDVLPQPPSPTITIFSSFLPGPGAPGASIAVSSRHWQPRAGQTSAAERSGAGAGSRGGAKETPPAVCRHRLRQAATRAHLPASVFLSVGVPARGVHLSFPGKLRQLRNGGTQPVARLPLPPMHVKARPPPTRFDRFRRSSQGTPDWQAPPSGRDPLIGRLASPPPTSPSDRDPLIGGSLPQHQGSRSFSLRLWKKSLVLARPQLCGLGQVGF